jgi:ubiquinone/menaquinone biosynthesis C-methylase UbiE
MITRNPLLRPGRWRANLVQDLTGDVLEIGVGRGDNLPYYRQAHHVWAIEPDPERAAEAQRTALTATVPVTVEVAPAEALPYDDSRFDQIVASLVFCSVADPQQTLQELQRVLRPGGKLHLVEHVRPTTPWLARIFGWLTPWWRRVAHNCHLDRPTIEVLQAAGWSVQIHKRRAMFVRMTAQRPEER